MSVDGDEGAQTVDGDEPTLYEKRTLRRVGEKLPKAAYIVAVVELCERFSYYGAQGLFQNYITKKSGLGKGRTTATALTIFFTFFSYLTPILGAILADQYFGRYKTILGFAVVYTIGLLILWVTALPVALEHGAGFGGFIAAIITIALGTGGIKSNVAPLIADQYHRKTMAIKTLAKTGERVIIDPAITYHRIYLVYYGCIELGSLSIIGTPFMEKDYGHWAPFLLTFCMFVVGITILILGRRYYTVRPPQGSIIQTAFKAVGLMILGRSLDAPKPSVRAIKGKTTRVPWDDHFVEELKRTLNACKVFAFFPIIWVCFTQMSSNLVAQAGQMDGHGLPNDFMQSLERIVILLFLPLLDQVIMPLLRKRRILFRPIARITTGFYCIGLGVAYAAIVQHLIYNAGPCWKHPLACKAAKAGGHSADPLPNHVHMAIQTPLYVFFGFASIFLNVTGPEYAYTKSPPSLKSFIQSLYLLTVAFGAALAEALVSVSSDPKIIWMYVGIAVSVFVIGTVMYLYLGYLDREEDKWNDLDRQEAVITREKKSG
ncbi:PTR2-domain-containing protein [Mytilinidion resinicola]|uniref:PTR2-domain-containing protein n=1 Tax=Mytilinidion resinicola TaxID=574789 RepID=A0A6A6YC30_9PEZI|nr:PTR2-domain-containing protein [Mytilinidion resinicola]KAF2806138.1 PTR2-domain-containing protein [Mytilinidion resinicola]